MPKQSTLRRPKRKTQKATVHRSPKRKPVSKKDPIRDLAHVLFQAMVDTKGIDILVLDVRDKVSFTDYLIICSGTSDRQVNAITNRVEEFAHKKCHRHPLGVEGKETGLWVLMDFGDAVCHIFQEEVREFYRLEDLWHDAKRVRFKAKK